MTHPAQQWIYTFGAGQADGHANMAAILGSKGAHLAEMSRLGLSVPPGFTLSTEVCDYFYQHEGAYPDNLREEVEAGIALLEHHAGAKLGHEQNPLLLSVRSGARASMPGMMDTILNLGLNDRSVLALAERSGDDRFAWDSYRRLMQMYGSVVMGIDYNLFEACIAQHKAQCGVEDDLSLDASDWRALLASFKDLIDQQTGMSFPQDPHEQLWQAIGAVFKSWMTPRAQVYRRLHHIPESWGTAVNVQSMVFGNMGSDSASGVAFTRDPSQGVNVFYGEYLVNAQGEDVVSGIRTPAPLTKCSGQRELSLEDVMPDIYRQLLDVRQCLEHHFKDMQDIEFTVEQGRLFILQTRAGKRTPQAALAIAVDLCHEGLITRDEAIMRIDPATLEGLLHPMLDPQAPREIIASGLPASPGAASGLLCLDPDQAEKLAAAGKRVILARSETSPEDIHGMHAACGILTARGGMTSHAAVVARGMGRPCVTGAGGVRIDEKKSVIYAREGTLPVLEGTMITIDGSSGEVMLGEVPTIAPEMPDSFHQLMTWADEKRNLRVRVNADTPHDACIGRRFGAEGVGLCRTEHMFFGKERILAMRSMIIADHADSRRAALDSILPMQREDFAEIFRVMAGLPVVIRLLDPPLHEFLPKTESEILTLAENSGKSVEDIRARIARLEEINPMLGHRGCRLGMSFPEIYEIQAQAIFEAALLVEQDIGLSIVPEIMIPLILSRRELDLIAVSIMQVAKAVAASCNQQPSYIMGAMIELPRAALLAGDIAKTAHFLSFGTNDLTQTSLGLSRDDAGSFLEYYIDQKVFPRDPFVSLDVDGVGELIQIARSRSRIVRPEIQLGICGEHGGNPESIAFCEDIGLNYVSCSPYRVPIARLAAARAAIAARDQQGEDGAE